MRQGVQVMQVVAIENSTTYTLQLAQVEEARAQYK